MRRIAHIDKLVHYVGSSHNCSSKQNSPSVPAVNLLWILAWILFAQSFMESGCRKSTASSRKNRHSDQCMRISQESMHMTASHSCHSCPVLVVLAACPRLEVKGSLYYRPFSLDLLHGVVLAYHKDRDADNMAYECRSAERAER